MKCCILLDYNVINLNINFNRNNEKYTNMGLLNNALPSDSWVKEEAYKEI